MDEITYCVSQTGRLHFVIQVFFKLVVDSFTRLFGIVAKSSLIFFYVW